MVKALNVEAEAFCNRANKREYPILVVDALYEKVRENGHIVSMVVMVVCGVNLDGYRHVAFQKNAG